jgi:hypothetical protein
MMLQEKFGVRSAPQSRPFPGEGWGARPLLFPGEGRGAPPMLFPGEGRGPGRQTPSKGGPRPPAHKVRERNRTRRRSLKRGKEPRRRARVAMSKNQLTANFISFTASLFTSAPPTRLVA